MIASNVSAFPFYDALVCYVSGGNVTLLILSARSFFYNILYIFERGDYFVTVIQTIHDLTVLQCENAACSTHYTSN